ncbi:MAG: hypothetical protein J0H07_06865 [Sphingobacteriales bacterium]|nr:hypothetical protein [Sphingobacteriales bacterium]
MKTSLLFSMIFAPLVLPVSAWSQQRSGDAFDRANNALNKVTNTIAVFQPYLLKARQLFYDGKQLANDVRNAAKQNFGKHGADSAGGYNNGYNNSSYNNNSNNGYNTSNPNGNYGNNGNGNGGYYNGGSNNNGTQNYLPGQSLPVNNPATINNDGTGNWGNQNNGLYGNCLDVLTGTVMGMGDAAQSPSSVDLMFFAPADGQNTYTLMTPGFARNNSTAGYMTEHVSEQVQQWSDVNESEVSPTRLTLGQFNQIQNNSQIQNAVRNAHDYAGYYNSAGQKLDGQVFAVKVQADHREVYALVAIFKQFGTSGSNGYLKITIKSIGIDANHDGQPDANAYIR